MTETILDTADLADLNGLDQEEEISDMSATADATHAPMEFHVQMHGHTFHDMKDLIVNAAAQQIMGWHSEGHKIRKMIEDRCVERVTEQADAALAKVTAEIIDQPMTPTFGDKKPVTMREFIGLTGREYLTERVDNDGNPSRNGGWGGNTSTRIERLVSKYMDRHFKSEIEKATNAVITEIRAAIKSEHERFLAAEKARLRAAISKMTDA